MPTQLTGDQKCSELEALCEQTRRFPGPAVTLNLSNTHPTSLGLSTRPQSPAQILIRIKEPIQIQKQEPIQIQINFQNLTGTRCCWLTQPFLALAIFVDFKQQSACSLLCWCLLITVLYFVILSVVFLFACLFVGKGTKYERRLSWTCVRRDPETRQDTFLVGTICPSPGALCQ